MESKNRIRILALNDKEIFFDFGTYAIIMYYASQIDDLKCKKLFDATFSEVEFRSMYNLSIDNIFSNDRTGHFVYADLQEIVSFLENVVIPSMEAQANNLLTQYGGVENFITSFYSSVDYLQNIGITQAEYFEGNPEELVNILTQLKIFFQFSLALNQAYIAYVD